MLTRSITRFGARFAYFPDHKNIITVSACKEAFYDPFHNLPDFLELLCISFWTGHKKSITKMIEMVKQEVPVLKGF